MSAELETRLAKLAARGHRAVVAGVIRDGERECRALNADASALFEIGSITKAFTGVLLADMHLRGEVSLDDPLSQHLPAPAPAWRHREPTLLDLATHRSELPNTPKALGRKELAYMLGIRKTEPWAGVTEDVYAELVTQESPKRPPGGRVRYSSMGVGLLGDALASRAGTTYEELLRRRVLEPLDMASTAVTVADPARLEQGHSRRGRPRPPIEDFLAPAGGVRSDAEDMLRFLAACLDPGEDELGRALALALEPRARISKKLQVGLCWVIAAGKGPDVVWHNGGTWGFRAFAGFAPARGSAAIVMSNTARSVDRVGFELAAGLS